jgi:flagellar basal-body rod protein FlgB
MDQNIELLGKLMDATTLRHRVLANNLANANTPGYLRKDVEFTSVLSKALETGPDSLRAAQFEATVDSESPVNGTGNSVSLQKELGEMMQNSLLYDFATEMTSLKLAGLRKAITGTK